MRAKTKATVSIGAYMETKTGPYRTEAKQASKSIRDIENDNEELKLALLHEVAHIPPRAAFSLENSIPSRVLRCRRSGVKCHVSRVTAGYGIEAGHYLFRRERQIYSDYEHKSPFCDG
jgi:hypothetical protein